MNPQRERTEDVTCGAKTRSGEPCQNWPLRGANRCRMHGGKSLYGPLTPNYQGKGYSKYLPPRMMDDYQESLADPDLLALREDIALVKARIEDLLKRVDTGDSGRMMQNLRTQYRLLQDAIREGDTSRVMLALDSLNLAINTGESEYATWGEIIRLSEQRRKLVESERKRLVDMQQMITNESALMLVAALLDILKTRIDDTQLLAQIGQDVRALTG